MRPISQDDGIGVRVSRAFEFVVRPIGWVESGRRGRADDDWGDVESTIRLDAERFSPDALAGLGEFSHVEVIFLFDQFDEVKVQYRSPTPAGKRGLAEGRNLRPACELSTEPSGPHHL